MNFEEDIRNAVETMRRGGVILYPTDTVWGLGCDASNGEAVRKIEALKHRAANKSMIVLVDGEAMLERVAAEVPEITWELLEAAVNPLTVVYDGARGVAPEVLAADGSLGIRITRERYSQALCRRLKGPVVSTSANLSGQGGAGTFAGIPAEIRDGVDYAAHYRREETGAVPPSNIIKISRGGVVKVIR